jgi:hypothetical protein
MQPETRPRHTRIRRLKKRELKQILQQKLPRQQIEASRIQNRSDRRNALFNVGNALSPPSSFSPHRDRS